MVSVTGLLKVEGVSIVDFLFLWFTDACRSKSINFRHSRPLLASHPSYSQNSFFSFFLFVSYFMRRIITKEIQPKHQFIPFFFFCRSLRTVPFHLWREKCLGFMLLTRVLTFWHPTEKVKRNFSWKVHQSTMKFIRQKREKVTKFFLYLSTNVRPSLLLSLVGVWYVVSI